MIVDTLDRAWTGLLGLSAFFVTPDWGALVGLLPIFVLVGVVGPILTLLVLAWLRYGVGRPGSRVAPTDPRRPAPRDADGRPVFPLGEPYSPREQVIYEPGATRSASGEALVVGCPKCGLVRPAAVDSCGNCGLSFTLRPMTIRHHRAGPPAGGAAAA